MPWAALTFDWAIYFHSIPPTTGSCFMPLFVLELWLNCFLRPHLVSSTQLFFPQCNCWVCRWTWLSGTFTPDVNPVYGTLGQFGNNNTPGARSAACMAASGNSLYLLGDESIRNDLVGLALHVDAFCVLMRCLDSGSFR